jgi:hypothetical protein
VLRGLWRGATDPVHRERQHVQWRVLRANAGVIGAIRATLFPDKR